MIDATQEFTFAAQKKEMPMKYIILILIMVQSAMAQPTLQKTWVGRNNDYIRIRKDTIDYFKKYEYLHIPYSLEADTMKVPVRFWKSQGMPWEGLALSFRIKSLTRDSLMLVLEFGDDKIPGMDYERRFIDSALTYDPKLTFDSLYFSASECFGNCPSLQIAISSTGAVRFRGRTDTEPFHGCYAGTLPQTWLGQLNEILRCGRIGEIPEDLGRTIDAPVYKLRITLNGKTKTISGTPFPAYDWPLLDILLDAYKVAELTKVDTVVFVVN